MAENKTRSQASRPQGQATRAPQGSRPTQGKRPAPKKRRKRFNPNNYLYIAITLVIVAMVLATTLICILVGCEDEESSYVSESSAISSTETSESSTESSENRFESSEDTSSEVSIPTDPIAESIANYEKLIGVEYAIDMTEFEEYVCPENESDFVFLVNPSHPLAKDYVPENLVKCTNIRKGRPESYSYIDATANKALEAFLLEAAAYGFDDITVTNAYRSYNTQAGLFENYLANDLKTDYKCDGCNSYIDVSYYPERVEKAIVCAGCEGNLVDIEGEYYCESCMSVADTKEIKVCSACHSPLRRPTTDEATAHVLTYSTRPGTSEHQSGLCCDMHNLPETTSKFDNTPEAIWLAENAHRFGFILRYPPNTQHITGIKHESWHFRYVGRTAATEIYLRGITLDEYLS